MKRRSPTSPTKNARFDVELTLHAAGGRARLLGGGRRWLYLGLTLWASVVAAGLWLGWTLRGLG